MTVIIYFFLVLFFVSQNVVDSKQAWEINEEYSDGGSSVFGDMILTPAQLLRYESGEDKTIRGVSVKASSYNRWENNIIPYFISPQYTSQQKAVLLSSIRYFEQVSCFKFIERSNQRDYIFIVPLDGCYSYVGKIGGRQTLSLAIDCIADYIIWHELMHAIGFEHEHQRPDRDSFIRVDYQNVIPNQLINFDKLSSNLVDFPDNYDYKSIMHYDGYAFGKVDQARRIRLATMTPLRNGIKLDDNTRFSATDIRKLNRLGKCRSVGTNAISGSRDCVDAYSNCEGHRKNGMCQNSLYRRAMIANCQKTCGFCNSSRDPIENSTPTSPSNSTSTSTSCQDSDPKCSSYAENGFCEHTFYDINIKAERCAKTCKLCK
ncbi:unnamed protein product [Caenorhabditis angaria]|uniref:Metalloendopeptidase n=1 Tax=Caenorhabditis angaria TaxID=860376 RepID=A0A9P1N5W0_9PELO|nr:unnamed protein product [Caenorhabditis angaria]